MRSIAWILFIGTTFFCLYGCYSKTSASSDTEQEISIKAGISYAITADINDIEDPFRNAGINLDPGDNFRQTENLSIEVSSSNQAVVPNSNLFLSGRNLRIIAATPGYTTISIKIIDGTTESSYKLEYAASLTPDDRSRCWHSGSPDASAAIGIDDRYMIVANDESNQLYLYDRKVSGPPIRAFEINGGNILGLVDSSAGKWKEVDIEGAARSMKDPSVTYWIGSMSNNSAFLYKPNRNRIFSMRASGTGKEIALSNNGTYHKLREHLVKWGDRCGYDLKSSAAEGKDCKTIDGFNIEGMVFGPDNKTMYIGFRAPLVPTKNRTKALIAPIQNFETWFNSGNPETDPQFGSPIELDLGGRGIRDIIRLPDNSYLIIAGSTAWELVPAAFTWTGKKADAPLAVTSFHLKGLNVEGVLAVSDSGQYKNRVQVLTDNGSEFFYCDTLCVKDLLEDRFKKFSSVVLPVKN